MSLFARLSGNKGVLPRGRAAPARPRWWTRCRAALPGGARLAPQPGGFKQKSWSVRSLVGFYFLVFFFSENNCNPLLRGYFFTPLPPAGPPDHHVLPLLPLASDWHASRTEELFFFPLFYNYLFNYLISLYFHCTFRLQLPKLFDLPRCLLTRKKTPALSAGSSAHTWAPWRASMLLPNLVTQRARGGTEGGMKGAAGGTSKAPPPRPTPALPYIGGAGGGRRFARESVLCPPAPLIAPGGVVIGTAVPPSPRSAPLKLYGGRPAAPSAGAQPAPGSVSPPCSTPPPRPEYGQAGLAVGECSKCGSLQR